jgi:2-dehydro-3-deoxyphosphogluconate aldolase/(4S)-4-hydroxy-2-oxoglutarate aldolase
MIRSARKLITTTRVIPVITIDDVTSAVPLARALVAGGLRTLEVTLRTPTALDAIASIAADVPDATVGAGTIRSAQQMRDAVAAGAQFLVAPGCTRHLLEAAADTALPFLPGVATASEVMELSANGVDAMKLFPAQAVGGAAAARALGAPFPEVALCPTGGIDVSNAGEYLRLPNVSCVGGSWMLSSASIASGDWALVERAAAEASRL